MASRCQLPFSSEETLSSLIASALAERDEDETIFVLLSRLSQQSGLPPATNSPCTLTKTVVTKQIWCVFVFLLRQRLSFSPVYLDADENEGPSSSEASSGASCSLRSRCDVGVYCSEVFYVCLVESACLFLGLSFCVFRPDDPPLRLERLERRRRPRHKLRLQDIDSLLQSATNEVKMGGEAHSNQSTAGASPCAKLPLGVTEASQRLSDAHIAYFIHTSGSTGDPKCVVASRANLHAYLCNFVYSTSGLAVTRDPPCRLFCLSSPFFDPSIGDMLTALCTPHCTFYTCSQEALLNGYVGELMAAVRPTHVVSTPAVWRTISLETLQLFSESAVASEAAAMKVFLGGERMSQELISTWAGEVELFNIYGVTEVTIYQSVQRVRADTRVVDMTCGSGVGTHIAVDMDAPHAVTVEEGTVPEKVNDEDFGEVILYGDQVCCGYAEDTEKLRSNGGETYAPSPFGYDNGAKMRCFRTGDIGKLVLGNDKGAPPQLVLRGRRDWQIKLNGQRVSIEEVEDTVQRALEGLFTQCACFCIKDGGSAAAAAFSTPVIGAALVLSDASSDKLLQTHREGVAEALQEVLSFHLPSFMIPRSWLLYARGSSLPQTATGKVNRSELARLARSNIHAKPATKEDGANERGGTDDTETASQDSLYTTVQAAWELHFGMPVHANTHFLYAGGDSLGALKLTRAIYLRLHNGSGDGVDEYGGLPSPFQPCVLLQHPRLGHYVAMLRRELHNNDCSNSNSPSLSHVIDHQDSRADVGASSSALSVTSASTISSTIDRMSALFREVAAAHCFGLAERVLRHGVVDVNGGNTREHRCVTPLHIAVSSCGGGGEGTANETDGSDAARIAAALRMVQVLLSFGAKPTAVTPDGVTPAHLAAAVSTPILRLLLEQAPTLVHCREGRQQSLLHFAARAGNVAAVHLLLCTYQLKLDMRDKWQRTPVHWAVLNGHLNVLEEVYAYCTASPSSHGPVASLSTQSGVELTDEANTREGEGLKGSRRQGCKTARFRRLARKRTYLAYETLCGIAQRTRPGDERMMELCRALSVVVGEDPDLK